MFRLRTASKIPLFARRFSSFAESSSSAAELLDVSSLARRMRKDVCQYTASCTESVRLVGILSNDGRPDADLYQSAIRKTCEKVGIDFELLPVEGTPSHVHDAILNSNQRDDVHGILVFYPISENTQLLRGPYKNRITGVYYKTQDDFLRDAVCPSKDVEGLCHQYNARWLFRRQRDNHDTPWVLYPCTAVSVLKILETYHCSNKVDWESETVTIVNRSEIWGRPLAAMLALQGATVYSVDADSVILFTHGRRRRCLAPVEQCLQESSVVVTGVPSPDYRLPTEHLSSETTTLVNVSAYPNVCVDSLPPNVQYVPQIGQVTVASLLQNLVQLHQLDSVQA